MKKIAISIGDVNGIGLEIALKAHSIIKKSCIPLYFVDSAVVQCASAYLEIPIPSDFETIDIYESCSSALQNAISQNTLIASRTGESRISALCGEYSFKSVQNALQHVEDSKSHALLTLPIHKKAWELAGVDFVGHTDFLSKYFGESGIMMLGCEEMFVALFSDHIPLKDVAGEINFDDLVSFFRKFEKNHKFSQALVLGLNPHAGDNGVLGSEDVIIDSAINAINKELGKKKFIGSISPDIAFSPRNRARFKTFVTMYHDQGLAPLKALYFDQSINVTLGLPLMRVSVDHGVAFDIAYTNQANITSYVNAIEFILKNA